MSVAGWYADPVSRAQLRWWDGSAWSDHVRTGPTGGLDPLDPSGNPLTTSPTWTVPPPVPPRPVLTRPRVGRGLVIGLICVGVTTVALLVVGGVVAVSLLGKLPAISTTAIEADVATQMGRELGEGVSVSCPSIDPFSSGTRTIRCRATFDSGESAAVVVRIRGTRLIGWNIDG